MDHHEDEQRHDGLPKKTRVNKLVLLGDVYVGKTSIAYRYICPQ